MLAIFVLFFSIALTVTLASIIIRIEMSTGQQRAWVTSSYEASFGVEDDATLPAHLQTYSKELAEVGRKALAVIQWGGLGLGALIVICSFLCQLCTADIVLGTLNL